jgi:hypothetical protein
LTSLSTRGSMANAEAPAPFHEPENQLSNRLSAHILVQPWNQSVVWATERVDRLCPAEEDQSGPPRNLVSGDVVPFL